jgi:hypothetical protein
LIFQVFEVQIPKFIFVDRNIDPNGAHLIAENIKNNSSVTLLKLFGNRLGDTGVKYIAGALKQNKSLIWLFLDGELSI